MGRSESENVDQTVTLIWSQAGVQRELATAIATRDLRMRRIRNARTVIVIAAAAVFVCGVLVGWTWATVTAVGGANLTGQIESSQPRASEPSRAASTHSITTPDLRLASPAVGAKESSAPVPPVSPPLQARESRIDPTTLLPSNSLTMLPRDISDSKLGLAEIKFSKSGKQVSDSSGGYFESNAVDQTVLASQAGTSRTSPNASEPGFKLAGVPVDGIALIQIEGGAIRAFKLGQKLPDGSIIQSANSKTGEIQTTRNQDKK